MTPEEEKERIIFIMIENKCDYTRAKLILEKFGGRGGEKKIEKSRCKKAILV